MNTLAIITLAMIFLILYHHLVYPLLLRFIPDDTLAKKMKRYSRKHLIHTQENLPKISILLPAYNEEKYIADKIRNLAALDYPKDKYQVVIACDGCTDNTVKEAITCHQELFCKDMDLRIVEFPLNRGKVAILNALIPQMKNEIVVLSDISALVSLDALQQIAEEFNDQSIGAVNGNYRLLSPSNAGEENYWRYQKQVKIGEQALGSVLGAHGAFYAIRRSLFRKLPDDTINDDFVIPMRILEQGFRVTYNTQVNAIELEQNHANLDWRRRVRIGFGNAQQILILRKLFQPKYKGVAFSFFSGKGLRVLMPFFMIFTLISSWILSSSTFFALLAICQTGVYLSVLLTHIFQEKIQHPILRSIHYLIIGHLASLYGCVKYLSHQRNLVWS